MTRSFDRLSAIYDSEVLQAVLYRPPQDAILAELRRARPRRVVDVGCGTGILASRVSRELHPDLVYGCDLSDGMLGQARARSSEVVWVRAGSESLPLRPGSVDAVVSSHAFHWFDQEAAVAEFRRVLVPGGLVAVAVVAPRSLVGTRVVDAAFGGTGHFPDLASLRALFVGAGFASVRQTRIRRAGVNLLSPDVVTVAMAP